MVLFRFNFFRLLLKLLEDKDPEDIGVLVDASTRSGAPATYGKSLSIVGLLSRSDW